MELRATHLVAFRARIQHCVHRVLVQKSVEKRLDHIEITRQRRIRITQCGASVGAVIDERSVVRRCPNCDVQSAIVRDVVPRAVP